MAKYKSKFAGDVIDATLTAVIDGQAGIQGVKVNNSEVTPDLNNKVDLTIPNVVQSTGESTTDVISQGAVTTQLNSKATTNLYTGTLTALGWEDTGGVAPYTQTISVSGILSSDTPFVDLVLSSTTSTAKSQIEAFTCVSKVETSDDEVTATCFDNKPNIDLPIMLKVIR